MKILIKGLLGLSGLFVLTAPARADIAWLVNGTFADGGTLSGTFYLDQYGYLAGVDIATTANGAFAAVDYVKGSNAFVNNGSNFIEMSQMPNYNGTLRLNFDGDITLTNPGLSLLSTSFECQNSQGCSAQNGTGITRLLASGIAINTSVPQPVPEPASWALMIGGFGLVGTALRRRTHVTFAVR